MLFKVEMDVVVPQDLDEQAFNDLKAREKEFAQELQHKGVWRHLWRVVGQYKNVSIFDVESNEELHNILTSLPLFPFMTISVKALCRHPSSIHKDDR